MDVGLRDDMNEFDGYLLLKFTTKKEFQRDFLNGKIFFNTADFFSRCDDKGRGDADEGNTFIIDYENPGLKAANLEKVGDSYAVVVRDYSANPEEYRKGTIWEYSAAINRNRKILSMYTMFVNIVHQQIEPTSKKMKEEFGRYGILITDRQEFFRRVFDAVAQNPKYSDLQMGFVSYMPKEQQVGLMDWNPFIKRDRFAYQKEFRIAFVSDNENAVKLDLGCSIKDIAVPIMVDDIDEIHFNAGKLLYPTVWTQRKSAIKRFFKGLVQQTMLLFKK